MRNIMMFAAVATTLGIFMARVADSMVPAAPASATTRSDAKPNTRFAAITATDRAPAASGRSVTIPKDSRGHFQADARVDGRNLGFMIDTGASTIALNESSAAHLGIRPFRGDFTTPVSTANGKAMAATARLASIDVGGVVVRNVDALILPDSQLSQNLLGMTFLSRLKRFEYANGKLVLEQ
jgi:aspartyl protease family protein